MCPGRGLWVFGVFLIKLFTSATMKTVGLSYLPRPVVMRTIGHGVKPPKSAFSLCKHISSGILLGNGKERMTGVVVKM